jgi:hypothetical protein
MKMQRITIGVEYDMEPLDLSDVESVVQALAGPVAEYGERAVVWIDEELS